MKVSFQRLKNLFRRTPAPVNLVTGAAPETVPLYPWFGVVESDDLQQGDIFESCPVYFPPDELANNVEATTFKWGERDLIVISQSCDLTKDPKNIDQVSLCETWRRSEYKEGTQLAKLDNLEKVRKGQMPRYHLLAPSEISGFERELRIVDLQQVHSLPVSFLRARAVRGKRLRLLPPYREHLSQSFARAYMRVGLPIDIPPFKNK